jgi:hypothetical protein
MTIHTDRPWLALYDEGMPAQIEREHESALGMSARRRGGPRTAPRSATSTRG